MEGFWSEVTGNEAAAQESGRLMRAENANPFWMNLLTLGLR
jgi:hypothetical protein